MTWNKEELKKTLEDSTGQLYPHVKEFIRQLKNMPDNFTSAELNEAIHNNSTHTGQYNSYLTVFASCGLLEKKEPGQWRYMPLLRELISTEYQGGCSIF